MIHDLRFTVWLKRAALASLLLALNVQLSAAFAQGSLTPPGAPGPTMLTLSQIEPRTPISSAPYTISQSGSYYLTTNLVDSTGTAITIDANGVTLDLNGFSIADNSGPGYGIFIPGSYTNIVVKNGLITGWPENGVYCGANTATFERLTLTDNSIYGLVFGGTGNVNTTVRSCTLSGNGTGGISCLANNVTIEDSIVSSNGYGLFISGVNGGIIRDCTINGNVTEGISCINSTNLTWERLVICANNNSGAYLAGLFSSVIRDCSFEANIAYGINLSGSGCSILDNNFNGNAYGMDVSGANNQIDGNHIIGNGPPGLGILMFTGVGITNNFVIRNYVTGYGSGDYSIGSSEIVGPIINSTSSGTITNSNPWANFAF
jgi:parallel beta-helix repeat protein